MPRPRALRPFSALPLFGLVLGLATGRAAASACAAQDTAGPIAAAPRSASNAPPEPAAPVADLPVQAKDAPDADTESAPPAPRKIHGVIEAGIGTGGYRRAAAAVVIPVGADGEVAIAVEKTTGAGRRFVDR